MSVSDFLSDFADVDVDRAVADDHAVAPDAGVDLFPGEEFSGRGGEQGEQGELLAGQFDTFSVADYQMSFPDLIWQVFLRYAKPVVIILT